MIGWHALLTSMERPNDETVTLALRLVRNDAVAVMMYGSRARGTERPDSDIDILAVVNNRPGSANYGNVSITYYTPAHLTHLAENGSLFVRHLRDEGKVTSDPQCILANILRSYQARTDFTSLRSDLEIVLSALSAVDRETYAQGLRRAGLWASRSAVYLVCAEIGTPVFDTQEACVKALVPDLAKILHRKKDADLDELREFGLLALKTYILPSRYDLATIILRCWDSNPSAARVLESVISGASRLEYTQQTMPVV